jgi:hypothetical protein
MTCNDSRETVANYSARQVRADQWPIVLLDYVGSRGTRRTSECKFNDVAAANRHGARLMGAPMR